MQHHKAYLKFLVEWSSIRKLHVLLTNSSLESLNYSNEDTSRENHYHFWTESAFLTVLRVFTLHHKSCNWTPQQAVTICFFPFFDTGKHARTAFLIILSISNDICNARVVRYVGLSITVVLGCSKISWDSSLLKSLTSSAAGFQIMFKISFSDKCSALEKCESNCRCNMDALKQG